MRRGITVAAVCATGALAACGGGSSSDFASKADAICTNVAKQTNQVFAEVGPVSSQQSAINLTTKLNPVYQQAYSSLKAIKPPASASAAYQQYLADRQQRLTLLSQLHQQAVKGDATAYGQVNKQATDVLKKEDAAAAKAGLTACAAKLPADQQAAVKQLATRNATVNDAAECTQGFTPTYVKQHFGSQQKCVAQQKGKSPVTSVTVTDISGVANVSATATVVPHGGPPNGKKFTTTFVYQNGHWLQDTLDPAS